MGGALASAAVAAAVLGAAADGHAAEGPAAESANATADERETLILPFEGQWSCGSRFTPPSYPGIGVTLHNGVALEDTCFPGTGPAHVYVIGDWGGRSIAGEPPKAAYEAVRRDWVEGADDEVQQRIAALMRARAQSGREPDYILNMGDNFYWAGVEAGCADVNEWSDQWINIFENIYTGSGIDGKQWLGVLGNHDYGGYRFDMGWPQSIAYTWMPESRWMTPAQYWSSKVFYPERGFSVDYFFVDSNVFDTDHPHVNVEHNICSVKHNTNSSCIDQGGPLNVHRCPDYFQELWDEQVAWLHERLERSSADWQIVITHFPPTWGAKQWGSLAEYYGIDLILSGHVHNQQFFGEDCGKNPICPTPFIISGGGGGITSESVPHVDGQDDEYGFVDLTLFKEEIIVELISHGGVLRNKAVVRQRQRGIAPQGPSDPQDPRPTDAATEDPFSRARRERELVEARARWEDTMTEYMEQAPSITLGSGSVKSPVQFEPTAWEGSGDAGSAIDFRAAAARMAAPLVLAAAGALAFVALLLHGDALVGALSPGRRKDAHERADADARGALASSCARLQQAVSGALLRKGGHEPLAQHEPPREPASGAASTGSPTMPSSAPRSPRSPSAAFLDGDTSPAPAGAPPSLGAAPGSPGALFLGVPPPDLAQGDRSRGATAPGSPAVPGSPLQARAQSREAGAAAMGSPAIPGSPPQARGLSRECGAVAPSSPAPSGLPSSPAPLSGATASPGQRSIARSWLEDAPHSSRAGASLTHDAGSSSHFNFQSTYHVIDSGEEDPL